MLVALLGVLIPAIPSPHPKSTIKAAVAVCTGVRFSPINSPIFEGGIDKQNPLTATQLSKESLVHKVEYCGIEGPKVMLPFGWNPLNVDLLGIGIIKSKSVIKTFWKFVKLGINGERYRVAEDYLGGRFSVVDGPEAFTTTLDHDKRSLSGNIGVSTGLSSHNRLLQNSGLSFHVVGLLPDSIQSFFHRDSLSAHFDSLSFYETQGPYRYNNAAYTDDSKRDISSPDSPFTYSPNYRSGSRIGDVYGGLIEVSGIFVGIGFECWAVAVFCLWGNKRSGWVLAGISAAILGVTIASAVIGCFPGSWHKCLCDGQEHSERSEPVHRDGKTLAQSQIANYFDCIALGLRPSGAWENVRLKAFGSSFFGFGKDYGRMLSFGQETTSVGRL